MDSITNFLWSLSHLQRNFSGASEITKDVLWTIIDYQGSGTAFQKRLKDHHESLRVNMESFMAAMLLSQNSLVTVLLFNNICRYLQ